MNEIWSIWTVFAESKFSVTEKLTNGSDLVVPPLVYVCGTWYDTMLTKISHSVDWCVKLMQISHKNVPTLWYMVYLTILLIQLNTYIHTLSSKYRDVIYIVPPDVLFPKFLKLETLTYIWSLQLLSTLRPRQNGRHFADDTFKTSFMNENVWI